MATLKSLISPAMKAGAFQVGCLRSSRLVRSDTVHAHGRLTANSRPTGSKKNLSAPPLCVTPVRRIAGPLLTRLRQLASVSRFFDGCACATDCGGGIDFAE